MVEALLEQARKSIDSFELDLALKFCQRALETDPQNTQALEMTGCVYMELGNVDDARSVIGITTTRSNIH